MSKLSYQLQIKRYQKELGLDSRKFNALDVKHSDINLLKQLQILNPIASVPPEPPEEKTGFWGIFVVFNQTIINHRFMDVYLAYNDVALTDTQRIHGDNDFTFNITEENRLPLPSSTLQLKITMQNNTEGVDVDAYDQIEITGFTSNPLNEENTLSMLVNENNYDDGQCSITFAVTYEAPGGG